MTIVEEIDKASGRTQRSKNIVDALKFWWKLDKTPQNIGESVQILTGTGVRIQELRVTSRGAVSIRTGDITTPIN